MWAEREAGIRSFTEYNRALRGAAFLFPVPKRYPRREKHPQFLSDFPTSRLAPDRKICYNHKDMKLERT